MHVFAADWATVFIFVFEAAVGVIERDGNAHAAFVTVSEILMASYAADAAFVAVEGFFS